MKLKLPVAALAAAGVALAVLAANQGASAQAPGPSVGEVLVSGLIQPKGIEVGPDGALYVAESGTGGDIEVTLGEGDEAATFFSGYTGRISRIDPDTGARTTVVDGLPSNAFPPEEPGGEGEAVGPADVAFLSGNLYYLQTHAGEVYGTPDFTTGIYRVADDGDLTLVADIFEFNADNPVDAITSGTQVDVEPGGNPYAMDVHNGAFYVSDGNHNRLMRVTTGGTITEITEFPNHPVSTGMDFSATGAAYVAHLGQGPFAPEDGKVVSVNLSGGAITEHASGVSMLTDVEFHPDGQLYALSFNDTTAGEFPAFGPFTGSIQTVNADGTMSPLVTGLSFATHMTFDGDTAYVVNWGVTSQGEIVKIEDFSTVEPPAAPTPAPTQPGPAATATSPTGIAAPDTGTGSSGSEGSTALIALLGVAGIVLAAAGVRFASRRSS